jgi:cytochrome c553
MSDVAMSVADSRDLGTAIQGIAALAKSCGDCHSTQGGPPPMIRELRVAGSGAEPAMKRHAWAARELWDGLVVPSDEAWTRGARELSEPSLAPELLTPGKSPGPKVEELLHALRAIARRAKKIDATDERATVYAAMLATCAGCHAWLGGGRRLQ